MKTIDSTFESTLYPRLLHKTYIKKLKFSARFTKFNIKFNAKKHIEIAKSPFMPYTRVNRGGGGEDMSILSIPRENGQRVILKNYF